MHKSIRGRPRFRCPTDKDMTKRLFELRRLLNLSLTCVPVGSRINTRESTQSKFLSRNLTHSQSGKWNYCSFSI